MSDQVQLTDYEWQTLRALANALLIGFNGNTANYKQEFESMLSGVYPEIVRKIRIVLHVLSFRGTAVTLTGSPKLLTEMSPKEVRKFALSLMRARLTPFRQLGSGLLSLALMVMYRSDPEFRRRLGEYDPHPRLVELQSRLDSQSHLWHIPKFSIPKPLSVHQAAVVSSDVVIVGSGCSAMVAAYRLTKKGFNVILVEKGYHINALTSPEHDFSRDIEGFENKGALNSSDASIFVLAGATVGGGGAVNWSCSLRPNEQVRNEFVEKGAPFYGTSEFDEALDSVEQVMRVSTKFGNEEYKDNEHSFTNSLILESSAKLNYRAKETGQNTGAHSANCGFIEFGSRQGEEHGGIAEWLRYSLENGARVLQRSEVVNIRHQHGHASGVEVVVDGSRRLLINCKRVVCAAGSLQTPVLLQRSQFRNRHIGKGLKLHPVTVAYGEFPDEIVNKRLDPIMTSVDTEVDNLDGLGHGPKIEAIHHRPMLVLNFLPYRSPEDWKQRADNFEHLCALLVITRDKGEGKVGYFPAKPQVPYIEYTPSNYDIKALHTGSLHAANLLYVGGARRVFTSSSKIPDFVSTKPKEQRSIWDPDYRAWYEKAKQTEFRLYETKFGSAHQMASCRMDDRGPKYGAVDGKGRLYECNNVHVIDTSVFPAASGVNPMITCMATSWVLAQRLIEDLTKLQTKL